MTNLEFKHPEVSWFTTKTLVKDAIKRHSNPAYSVLFGLWHRRWKLNYTHKLFTSSVYLKILVRHLANKLRQMSVHTSTQPTDKILYAVMELYRRVLPR